MSERRVASDRSDAANQTNREVRDFYARYLAAFATRDPAVASGFFGVPFCRFVGGRTLVATSTHDVLAWLRSSWARLDGVGCAQVTADVHRVDVLDPLVAVLGARGTRFDALGEPLERFDVTYTLVRPLQSDHWSIAAIASATADDEEGETPDE